MKSRVTILGSGTCVPSLERSACSMLLETGGARLLFDCGPGVMRRLLEVGVRISDISYILLSHFHPDHSGELASFLFALKYPAPACQKQPLTIIAGRGFKSFYDRLQGVYGSWIVLPRDLFEIVELDSAKPDTVSFSSFSLTSMPVVHRPESLAFRVTDVQGKSVVYSGDTDMCDSLVDIATDADVMICESATPDGQKVDGHLTPSLAGKIARAAKVKRLVLTHFYPTCDTVDVEKQCRSTYNGSIVLARDLMKMTP